jgi:hypothetical protein
MHLHAPIRSQTSTPHTPHLDQLELAALVDNLHAALLVQRQPAGVEERGSDDAAVSAKRSPLACKSETPKCHFQSGSGKVALQISQLTSP